MNSKLLGAILLIASTTIGAGTLALPVMTASFGFLWAAILFVTIWAILTYCAYLMVEINLWLPEKTNLVSMAKVCLGQGGQIATWILYMLLFYAILATYFSALSSITVDLVQDYFHVHWFYGPTIIGYVLSLGFVVYLGINLLDKLNRVLFGCLMLSLVMVSVGVFPAIDAHRILHLDISRSYSVLVLVVAAFGYQYIIPVLRDFLDSDLQQLRKAILIGSIIPLVVYLFWELEIILSLPLATITTISLLPNPTPALATYLAYETQSPWLDIVFRWFSYFAIVTSMLGLAYTVYNFLGDGFRVQRWKLSRSGGLLLTFLPPAIYAYFFPQGYLNDMAYGGLATLLLYVVIPVFMIWSGRYRKHLAFGYTVRGGKPMLLLLLAVSCIIIVTSFV